MVVVAGSTPVIRATMAATTTIPIVMPVSADPVEQRFVASLARPGGNVTGLTSVSLALSGKRLEVLRDTLPGLSHVAVLWNADNPAKALELAETESAAQELGIARVFALAVRSPSELEAAFASAEDQGATALVVLGDPLFNRNHERIAELARAYRLPAIFETPDLVRGGGLMAYGPAVPDLFRRAAVYVDRILKGTPPSELPVERPVRFYLVINLREAQALDLTIPPRVLRLANEVVQ
jgi:putative tryptophan/tyrosine transport system substrate-binding protein